MIYGVFALLARHVIALQGIISLGTPGYDCSAVADVGWPATRPRIPSVTSCNRTKNFGDIAVEPSSPRTHGPDHHHLWEQPMPVGGSFVGANRLGEGHDKISTDWSGGGLVGGRSHDSHGPKWAAHWRISTGAVESESLWLLRLPSSPLWPPSSLLRLLSSPPPSSVLVSLLKRNFGRIADVTAARGCPLLTQSGHRANLRKYRQGLRLLRFEPMPRRLLDGLQPRVAGEAITRAAADSILRVGAELSIPLI
jgi:hypothetical protein